jgi:hypothetical protein
LRCLQCLLDPQKGTTGCQKHSDIIRDDSGMAIDTIERLKAWPREKMTACQLCEKSSRSERCMSIWSNRAGNEVSSLSETNPRRQLTYFSNT